MSRAWNLEPRFSSEANYRLCLQGMFCELEGMFNEVDIAEFIKLLREHQEKNNRGQRELIMDCQRITSLGAGVVNMLLTTAVEIFAKLPTPCRLVMTNVHPRWKILFGDAPTRYSDYLEVRFLETEVSDDETQPVPELGGESPLV